MPKNCFIDKERPCDLTCKAAFPVDDPVDPVDCFFIWLAGHLGDGALDLRQMLEGQMPFGGMPGPGMGPGPGSPGGGMPGGGAPPAGPTGTGPKTDPPPTGPAGFGVSPN